MRSVSPSLVSMDDIQEMYTLQSAMIVFINYKGRRNGFLKALKKDVDKLRDKCDKLAVREGEYLGLYAFPSGNWDIILSGDVRNDFPHSRLYKLPEEEPDKGVWLARVAADCDRWLCDLTLFLCGYNCFFHDDRKALFNMVNELPTIYESVTTVGVAMNEEESKNVDKAFKDFVTWRGSLIEALITDGDSFHKLVDGDRDHWQVNWPDGLLPGLPPEVMPPNFTCHIKSRMGWLIFFTLRIDGWLPSVALNYPGLGKNGRQSLFKKIEKLPRIGDIICRLAMMKFVPPDDEAVQGDDEDYTVCRKCKDYASHMYWTWCDTCEKDTILCCPGDECESCGNTFRKTVKRE